MRRVKEQNPHLKIIVLGEKFLKQIGLIK